MKNSKQLIGASSLQIDCEHQIFRGKESIVEEWNMLKLTF